LLCWHPPGATNRPQELDEAARRRFVKRLYIPLPDSDARMQLVRNLMKANSNEISEADLDSIVHQCAGSGFLWHCRSCFANCSTDICAGFSGADVANLCKEAAMGPVRHGLAGITDISAVALDSMPPITMRDFEDAFRHVRPRAALVLQCT
jgi:SpoVK/Ycf46/Vps4 family AAA+-type ATPase